MKTTISNRWELRKSPNDVNRKKDVLDRLLDGVEEEDWGDAAINQLCDELKTFILAGHETSSMMLTWAVLDSYSCTAFYYIHTCVLALMLTVCYI